MIHLSSFANRFQRMVFTWLMVVNSKLKGPGILFPSSLGAQDI